MLQRGERHKCRDKHRRPPHVSPEWEQVVFHPPRTTIVRFLEAAHPRNHMMREELLCKTYSRFEEASLRRTYTATRNQRQRRGEICGYMKSQGTSSLRRHPRIRQNGHGGAQGPWDVPLLGRNHNAAAGGLRNHNTGARAWPSRFLRFPLDVDTPQQRARTDERQRTVSQQTSERHTHTP